MKTIIHDLNNLNFLDINDDIKIIDACDVNSCVGCFSCWVKHPMNCIFNDKICSNGKTLLDSDELIIISKCVCGCYSSKVKRVLERSISYVDSYFTLRNGEIHHKSRALKKLKLKIYFYGNISENDKIIATKLILANQKNLNTRDPEIFFIDDYKEIEI